MTRPQIVRADTLDLQDKSSPTAADHSQHPNPSPLGTGPAAPHQEASLRRVEDERSNEKKVLQNGWNEANGMHEDDDDDTRTLVNGNENDSAAVRLNGGVTGDGDDSEMADTDVDDLDDMDRISSSPSISDGGYSLPLLSTDSHEERASTSPHSTPISSPPDCDSSSPYCDIPIHFPLAATHARRPYDAPYGVPAGSADPMSHYQSLASSFQSSQNKNKIQSEDHHRGEYAWTRTTDESTIDTDTCEQTAESSLWTQSPFSVDVHRQESLMREDSDMSLMSNYDEAVQTIPEPLQSPLINNTDSSPHGEKVRHGSTLDTSIPDTYMPERKVTTTSPHEESKSDDDSWTTDSDIDSLEACQNSDDDESNDVSFSEDSRFIDSGWGGICLQDTEDIDFEFVYALHTFVATVEGQANATKGDTMVLLDDSNSYWWLVRVVKDSSIGYLPAEHIETPTERLARLNKHRNIDLSATMLGDTAEKTKNPLRKAMRRRHAKAVTWGENITVEASDYDYSSDEGGEEEMFGGTDPSQAQAQQQQAQTDKAESESDDALQVQPLKVGPKSDAKTKGDSEVDNNSVSSPSDEEKAKTSDDSSERPMDPKVSRNGTLRNTDSFFKDENTETRKITLTPNLLRDDSSTSTTGSKERGPSLESLEKNGFADKVKEDKKKKKEKTGDKKPGMLSGLFKRKDKRSKGSLDLNDGDSEKPEKPSEEIGRSSPQSKPSDDLDRSSTEQAGPSKQTSKGKLQKSLRSREESPSKTKGILKTDSPEPTVQESSTAKEPTKPASTMRLVTPDEEDASKTTLEERERALSPEDRARSGSSASKLNPINILKTQQNGGEPRPEKVKKAKQRVQLDDFDSEEDSQDPFADPAKASEPEAAGRLSESPVHVSAADAQPPSSKGPAKEREQEPESHPPGLTGDTSSQETSSPISTPTPDDSPSTAQPNKASASALRSALSPSPTQAANSTQDPSQTAPASKESDFSPPNSSESTSLPAWSDHSLRTYLDDGSDIRDMLLVINDTTGVVPVGRDHPIMAQLFVEETKTVSGLSNELDTLLTGLLDKRKKKVGMRSTPSPVVAKAQR